MRRWDGPVGLRVDAFAEINLDRCIGCGLCAATCPEEAIMLTPKPETERRIPPASTADQMAFMANIRGMG